MPIYEFICQNCHRRLSFLVRDTSAPFAPKCSSCGNTKLSRVISGFAYHKSLKMIWEESGEPTMHPSDDIIKTPGISVAGWKRSSRTWDRSYRPRFRRRYEQPGKACYLSR
jgi:putative FmdB family regulatory protein